MWKGHEYDKAKKAINTTWCLRSLSIWLFSKFVVAGSVTFWNWTDSDNKTIWGIVRWLVLAKTGKPTCEKCSLDSDVWSNTVGEASLDFVTLSLSRVGFIVDSILMLWQSTSWLPYLLLVEIYCSPTNSILNKVCPRSLVNFLLGSFIFLLDLSMKLIS